MADWVVACRTDDVDEEDVIPVDLNGCPYAVYHSPDGRFYASDGVCTHEHTLLADGLVMGHIIECPKHNGRFNYKTGEVKRRPACVALRTYPVAVRDGRVWLALV